MRDSRFQSWLFSVGYDEGLAVVKKEKLLAYRAQLIGSFSPSGVNVAVAAINSLYSFIKRNDLKLKVPGVQARGLRPQETFLSYEEYKRLVRTAEEIGDERTALIIQALCAAGLRVSELAFLTVEAAQKGCMWVSNKGKTRQVLLPHGLCMLLLEYCRRDHRSSGPVFVGKSGNPLERTTVWRRIKSTASSSAVLQSKAYPHNFRHLFAMRYYEVHRDINAVSDALGHSKLETTRVYIASTAAERRMQIESLGLVCSGA